MNKTRLDRFSYQLAATVLVAGVAGFAGTAQADTVTSAAGLLEDASPEAIVVQEQPLFVTNEFEPEAIAQTTQPTPLDSPNQLPPPGSPVPNQPSQPGLSVPAPTPTPGSTPGTLPTPLDSPNQLPPPGSPVPNQPSQPGLSVPAPTPAPAPVPGTLPPPGTQVPGQPLDPLPTVPPTTQPVPPPTTRPAPPPRPRSGISPGRATRSGESYIGIGGNIGIGDGGTALGDGSFAVFSKIGLTSLLSIRPAVLFSDDATFLIPITIDFIPGITGLTEDVTEEIGLRASPYAGIGAAISTGDDGAVDFLATGGVDVPIGDDFTANAQLNVSLFDNPAVGLLLGVGYNF